MGKENEDVDGETSASHHSPSYSPRALQSDSLRTDHLVLHFRPRCAEILVHSQLETAHNIRIYIVRKIKR